MFCACIEVYSLHVEKANSKIGASVQGSFDFCNYGFAETLGCICEDWDLRIEMPFRSVSIEEI